MAPARFSVREKHSDDHERGNDAARKFQWISLINKVLKTH